MRGRLALAVVIAGLGLWGGAPGSALARPRGPRGAAADAEVLRRAETLLEGSSCRAPLLEELRTGTEGAPGCEEERRRLARALVRRPRLRFGYVERRDVELWSVQLVLGQARRCRTWPLRGAGRTVLDPRDVERAGCRPDRYEGAVAVALVDEAGRRARLPALRSDPDGRLRIVVAALDAAAREAGLGGLRRWRWIEVGEGGWAGRIDVERLHAFLADWHLRWVKAGRGVPGLFAAGHPQHAGADDARALAVEAQIARQREDFEAVRTGRLSPHRFLARYPWSPFRAQAQRLAEGLPARAGGAAGSGAPPQ